MAQRDYYETLGIEKTAKSDEVAKAYRHKALVWHPQKQPDSKLSLANHMFSELCEAYEVLSDEKRRKIYDEFGERGLKSGVVKPKWAGYAFSGDCFAVFKEFFGSRTPFQLELEEWDPEDPVNQDNDLEVTVYCTLPDLYNGCFKTVEYKRRKVMPDGRSMSRETVSKLIHI